MAEPAAAAGLEFDLLAQTEVDVVSLPGIELAAEAEPMAELDPPLAHGVAEPAPLPVVPEDEAPDAEMVEIFLEEAGDILESAGEALERWLAQPQARSALASLQRDLHTLKGGARMAGVRAIGDLAHELEFVYEGLTDGRFDLAEGAVGLLHEGHDLLARQVEELQSGLPLTAAGALLEQMRALRQGEMPNLPAGALPAHPEAEAEAQSEGYADSED